MVSSFNEWLERLSSIEKPGGSLFVALVWGFGTISSQLRDLSNKLTSGIAVGRNVSHQMDSLRDTMEDIRYKRDY